MDHTRHPSSNHRSPPNTALLRPSVTSTSCGSGIIPSAAAPQPQTAAAAAAAFSTKGAAAGGGGKKGKGGKDEAGGAGGADGAAAPVGDVSKVAPVNIYKGTFLFLCGLRLCACVGGRGLGGGRID